MGPMLRDHAGSRLMLSCQFYVGNIVAYDLLIAKTVNSAVGRSESHEADSDRRDMRLSCFTRWFRAPHAAPDITHIAF